MSEPRAGELDTCGGKGGTLVPEGRKRHLQATEEFRVSPWGRWEP